MPNYTGDPAASALTPDLGQNPGVVPILDLPADGEPANAASVAQPFQVLANKIAWLLGPRAKPSDYTDILPFRNSMGQTIDRVDAFGLRRGARYYREDWPTIFSEHQNTGSDYQPFGARGDGTGLSNNSQALPGWWWGCLNTTAYTASELLRLQDPLVLSGRLVSPRRFMITTVPSAAGTASAIFRNTHLAFATNALYALSFRISYLLSAGPIVVGMSSRGSGFFVGATDFPGGVYLKYDAAAGDTTWKFITRTVGGGATQVDTGVAPDVGGMRVRLVYRGSELDDAATTRAFCFINDSAPIISSTNMPAPGDAFCDFAAHIYTTTPGGFATESWLAVSDVEQWSYWLP